MLRVSLQQLSMWHYNVTTLGKFVIITVLVCFISSILTSCVAWWYVK